MSRFDTLYADVKKFYQDTLNNQLTIDSIAVIIRYTMELVQLSAKDLKGTEKKTLVLEIIEKLIKDILEDSELSEDQKHIILTLVDFAPSLIDSIVDFAKIYKGKGICSKLCCRS